MSRPTLSICVTTFNRLPLLPRLIDQLSGLGDELVVLDSHSTDGSAEWLAARDDVRLVQRPFDGHYGRHKNALLDAASGDWILLVDSDELLGDRLRARLRWLIRIPFATHFRIPRYWLAPGDGLRHVVAERLYPDYQTRLFRNRPVFRYGEEAAVHEHFPRRGRGWGPRVNGCHLFHLDFLIADRATREAKVARYDATDASANLTSAVYLWEDQPHALQPCEEPLTGVELPELLGPANGAQAEPG